MLERVLDAFEFSIDELLEGVDESEVRNHLRSIPLVNGHLLEQKDAAHRRQRNWFLASAICCVLDTTSVALGVFSLDIPISIYHYCSEEIVSIGDNSESFESLDAFIEKEFVAARRELFDSGLQGNNLLPDENLIYDELKAQYATLSIPSPFATDFFADKATSHQ